MTEDELRARVREQIDRRADDWRELQNRVRDRLAQYERDRSLSHAIYRIYTRQDRQVIAGIDRPHMKSEAKIVQEIITRRNGGARTRSGKTENVKPDPTFDLHQILDIIGVTVVCPFDSDVELMAARLLKDAKRKDGFVYRGDKQHKREDYQAWHVYVSIDRDPLSDLVCEVQVKSAIQDAFGWKTHSLAYKPPQGADNWFVNQFARIGQVLRLADSLSDELRKRLVHERAIGETKHALARQNVVNNIASRIATIDDARLRAFVEHSLAAIEEARKLDDEDRAHKLRAVEESVEQEFEKFGCTTDAFRVATLCAICWNRVDKVYWLERLFHKWWDNTRLEGSGGKEDDVVKAFATVAMMCMMAPYILGDRSSALALGKRAFDRVSHLKGEMIARLVANLAYFSAELAGARMGDKTLSSKALEYAELARNLHNPLSLPTLDTLGYVQIQT